MSEQDKLGLAYNLFDSIMGMTKNPEFQKKFPYTQMQQTLMAQEGADVLIDAFADYIGNRDGAILNSEEMKEAVRLLKHPDVLAKIADKYAGNNDGKPDADFDEIKKFLAIANAHRNPSASERMQLEYPGLETILKKIK